MANEKLFSRVHYSSYTISTKMVTDDDDGEQVTVKTTATSVRY